MLAKKTRHLRLKRAIAIFLLITIVNQVLAPTVAFALTAGPTAPEATNFEPIDTTDMVNPLTGSFTYGMPLLEVPGPEGSYPLALSYHAGIQPDEEASWVGLGWSLNPGAIARNVNGYPDDWDNIDQSQRNYWEGGKQSILTIGVDIPFPGNAGSVNLGLQFGQDTYKGFGIGWSVGLSVGLSSKKSPIGLGISGSVGVDPWGNDYTTVGFDLTYVHSLGIDKLTGSMNIGLNTNFNSVQGSVGGGVGYYTTEPQEGNIPPKLTNHSLLGASLNSSANGVHISVNIAGSGSASMVNNANAGKISTQSTAWTIPLFLGSISYENIRYWSDETANVKANGVIYNHSTINNISDMDNADDDNYQLPDLANAASAWLFAGNTDPAIEAGSAFPNFDNYSVTAQGLSGNIRPYILQSVLFKQNTINASNVYAYPYPGSSFYPLPSKWQFRFINDFSNFYGQQTPFSPDYNSDNSINPIQGYDFDTSPKYGNNDGNYGYDQTMNRLEGSKHIEYFTNAQIESGAATTRGFVDCPDQGQGGFIRTNYDNNQIGGFMITNESGVTYHYALPAYEGDEYTKNQLVVSKGLTYNELKKPAKYAYTWYLTAITGPDYVARGATPGLIDIKNDWGYFVKFDYGLWTSNYQWRTPAQGFVVDLDRNFETFSQGTKQVYYLDAIETRSHTAIFEKEIRADAKDVNGISGSLSPSVNSSLRLNNIYLFQNDQLISTIDQIRQLGAQYQITVNGQFVIDKFDITTDLASKCLRKIAFNYDYSTCPGVPNSYDPGGLFQYFGIVDGYDPNILLGKLTLLSIDMQGKGGVSMTPPIQFQYDLNPADPNNQDNIVSYSAPVTTNYQSNGNPATATKGTVTMASNLKFRVGDIIKFQYQNGGITYYCTLLSTTDNTTFNVLYLGLPPSGASSALVAAFKTKNPPYNKDMYDMWHCYKSDYVASIIGNENLARYTSMISNKSTDVWSLRKINSSLGANINIDYEGNTYNRCVLGKNRSIIVNSVVRNSAQDYTFNVSNEGLDLTSIFHVGDALDMVYAFQNPFRKDPDNNKGTALLQEPINDLNPNNIIVRTTGTMSTPLQNTNFVSGAYTGSPIVKSVSVNSIECTVNSSIENDLYQVQYTWQNAAYPGYNPGVIPYNTFRTGNISLNSSTLLYGGGLRVKNVTVDDLNGHIYKTTYDYSMPGSPNSPTSQPTSSGVTAYEPTTFEADVLDDKANASVYTSSVKQAYRYSLYGYHSQLLQIAREMPSPGIMYEYVTIKDSIVLPTKRLPNNGSTVYQFEVFKPEMIGVKQYNYSITNANGNIINNVKYGPYGQAGSNTYTYDYINKRVRSNMSIKDFTSRIGNLKRIINYDDLGNKLTEKITHYLHDNLENTGFDNQVSNYEPLLAAYNNLGVLKERYGCIRLSPPTDKTPGGYNELVMMSGRETFPTIQTGTTQIDYKNGTSMEETNLAFDFYTGAVTKTLTFDSFGNRFVNQVSLAYWQYPNLGLKTHDDIQTVQHKQMLSQQASNYTFSVDLNNNPIGVISATAQTWSSSVSVLDPTGNEINTTIDATKKDVSQSNIWRMEKSYKWMPNGTSVNNVQPFSTFVDFFSPGNQKTMNASWKKTSQITQYNVYSAALEASDINNNYAATRMGYNNSKVLFSGGIAKYNEIAYAGAEDALLSNGNFSNQISPGGGTVVTDSTLAHTGVNSLMVPAGSDGFNYTVALASLNPTPQNYTIAVWVKPAPDGSVNQANLYYQINGGQRVTTPTQTYTKKAGGSYLLELTIPASVFSSLNLNSGGNLVVGCTNGSQNTLYFDDFRFQPTAASATAYVYDNNTGELTYILGNSNLYTRFKYDAIGRLVRTYNEVLGKPNGIITNSIKYNYGKKN